MLEKITAQRVVDREAPVKVFHPKPKGDSIRLCKEGDTFMVWAPWFERIIAGSDPANPEARRQLIRQLGRSSVRKALEKAGIKAGDKVRCGTLEWRW